MPPPSGSTGRWRAPGAICRAAASRRSSVTGGSRSRAPSAIPARLRPGAAIVLEMPPPAPAEPQGEAIPLAVVYEDDDLIVIDKPAGLVVHPAAGHDTGTLVNALIAHCGESLSGIGGVKRPGIVHRLDKDTSGLLVVAKTDRAHGASRSSSPTMAAPARWSAPIWRSSGACPSDRAAPSTARSPAARQPREDGGRRRRARPPRAHALSVEAVFGPARAPVASLPALPAGDRPHAPDPRAYGAYRPPAARRRDLRRRLQDQGEPASPEAREALRGLGRQALHAAVLGFEHPVTGENLRFESPPPDMQHLIGALRQAQP